MVVVVLLRVENMKISWCGSYADGQESDNRFMIPVT